VRFMTIAFASLCLFICVVGAKAAKPKVWPTTQAALHWKPDRSWLRGAFCVHNHESVDWHLNHVDWQGHPSPYSGGMQFLTSTWRNAGGVGDAWQWSPREQLFRAWRVWSADGGSWSEWGTAGACGLR